MKTGVLLIHGLFGSPREYDDLSQKLLQAGYIPHAISQLGHGDRLAEETFHDSTSSDIIAHCLASYHQFESEMDRVVVVGHSLGGICTLMIAAHQPQKLAGAVSMAAPYSHAYNLHPHQYLKTPVTALTGGMFYLHEQMTGFERPLIAPWKLHRLVIEGNLILTELQQQIEHIHVPVMLAHSTYDLTIPYDEMYKLASNMPRSPQVITHTLSRCGHQIFPSTREAETTSQHILDFVTQVCDNTA